MHCYHGIYSITLGKYSGIWGIYSGMWGKSTDIWANTALFMAIIFVVETNTVLIVANTGVDGQVKGREGFLGAGAGKRFPVLF